MTDHKRHLPEQFIIDYLLSIRPGIAKLAIGGNWIRVDYPNIIIVENGVK